MELKISEQIELIVSKTKNDLSSFERASRVYDRLVQDGLAIKRGFNLKTTQEIYNSPNFDAFNQKQIVLVGKTIENV